MLNLLL
jgi:hypothetical protein